MAALTHLYKIVDTVSFNSIKFEPVIGEPNGNLKDSNQNDRLEFVLTGIMLLVIKVLFPLS